MVGRPHASGCGQGPRRQSRRPRRHHGREWLHERGRHGARSPRRRGARGDPQRGGPRRPAHDRVGHRGQRRRARPPAAAGCDRARAAPRPRRAGGARAVHSFPRRDQRREAEGPRGRAQLEHQRGPRRCRSVRRGGGVPDSSPARRAHQVRQTVQQRAAAHRVASAAALPRRRPARPRVPAQLRQRGGARRGRRGSAQARLQPDRCRRAQDLRQPGGGGWQGRAPVPVLCRASHAPSRPRGGREERRAARRRHVQAVRSVLLPLDQVRVHDAGVLRGRGSLPERRCREVQAHGGGLRRRARRAVHELGHSLGDGDGHALVLEG